MKHWILSFLIFTSLSGTCQVLNVSLDSLISKYESLGTFNGVIVIGCDTQNIKTYTYGHRNPATKTQLLTASDRFDLASLTKQFTGLAILQLAQKKMIDLDKPIGRYFPELSPPLKKVTIRQLTNHTNGIHDYYSLTAEHDSLNNSRAMELLSNLDTTVFTPGSRWGYSNSGYLLLSQLIERVTNSTFEQYCTENIFRPLKMTGAEFQPQTGFLQGFTAENTAVVANSFSSGAAGLYASATDMIDYYKSVSCNKDFKALLNLARTLADSSNEKNWRYGFGWFFTKDSTGKFRAHSGRNKAAYTYIRWYDYSNIFICILSNKNDDFIKPLREEICNLAITHCGNN